MDNIVLDSSAVLASILNEPGRSRVDALLDALDKGKPVSAAISSVNWCEILTRLYRDNREMTAQDLVTLLAGVELVPFSRAEAEVAAGFARAYPSLSLGDRACLALAFSRNATAWTTDKIWAKQKLSVDLEILR